MCSSDLQATMDTAQTNYDTAVAQRDVAKAQVESAKSQIESFKAQVEQAKAAVKVSETNLRYTTIRSPVNGTVISRNVDVGQTVAASLQAPTLFTIAKNLAEMQVDSNVSEADVGRIAVGQDATGKAEERCLAVGIGIGSGYLFPTTFQHEVFSDLTGERGVLMGALAGIMEAQYDVLRQNGHSPSEAFNETVEEATQSLYPLIGEKGMDWMYANCSTTAQRGALDWFKAFRDASKPVFEKLYQAVKTGDDGGMTVQPGRVTRPAP